ncbi:PQQ-binding-like beta-propeller repeat protein [Streptomyces sp. NPDC088729]|uniref:outer membrane protein assembly factor BamB family protein n=1 Tax=Streptomyces sp. NPDC088729 TaxID=3365876 RepID=UPI00382C18B9
MEALRQDDPRRFGRFTALARLHESASAVRYAARDSRTGEPAVVTAARPALAAVPAFRRRFLAEARIAERLAGGWVASPLDTGDGPEAGAAEDGPGPLWTATAYVPALPLAEAVRIAGPLPERPLRILGAGVAEILARVHAAGSVLQGLAPDTVLLAADGPRLTAFGPLGAAAAAEAKPGGQLSVRLGYLTPEQIEGREVGTPSDLFVLGLLLAYAATGTTPFTGGPAEEAARRIARDEPGLDAVPDALRALIAGCLAKDPAARPTAGTVAAELALEGAAGLARGGWLPDRLAAAVADQEARVLTLETPRETPREAVDGGGSPGASAPGEREGGDATRFLATGSQPPRTDRATTQLALPHEPAPSPDGGPAVLVPGQFTPPREPAAAPGGESAALVPARSAPPVPLAAPAGSAVAANTAAVPHQGHGGPAPYPAAALPAATGPSAGGPGGPGGPAAGPMVSLPLPPAPAPVPDPAAGRRALLITGAAAVGGLIVGGGAVAALGSGDTAAATAERPAPKPRRTLPGQAPEPRWIHRHPASEAPPLTTALWQDRLLIVTSESRASAIDLRTGERVWQRADAAGGQAALAAGGALCFVASPTEFLWLSPKDGTVTRRVRYADGFADLPGLRVGRVAGQSGPVVWFTGSHTVTVKAPKPEKGKKRGKDQEVVRAYFFAYDIVRRRELWRTRVPAGRAPGTPAYSLVAERSGDLLVRQEAATLTAADVRAAKGKGSIRSFDQKTGKPLWTERYGRVSPAAGITGDEDGRLYGAVGADLQAFEADTAKPLWRVEGSEGSVFGRPVVAGPLIHTTESGQRVGAVERKSGRVIWRRSTEVPGPGNAPSITLSAGGKTLFAADATQVTAFAAADGRRLWKFQDIGAAEPAGATVSAPYRVLTVGTTVVVQRDRSFYAFPAA